MAKVIAVLNVIAWAGFWAFGYLALTSGGGSGRTVTAMVLAAIGAAVGIAAWLWLVRHSEALGYARRANQVPREHRRQGEGAA